LTSGSCHPFRDKVHPQFSCNGLRAPRSARAEGFGKWELIGTIITLYARDGSTSVHAFTLNDASNPTMRA